MAGDYIIGSNPGAPTQYNQLASLMLGFPRKGAHVRPGRGRHVTIPDNYTPGAPGWTAHWDDPLKHHTRNEWSCAALPDALINDPTNRARLSAGQLTQLDSIHATKQPLPADWIPIP